MPKLAPPAAAEPPAAVINRGRDGGAGGGADLTLPLLALAALLAFGLAVRGVVRGLRD